jgi:hypothetical protein
MVPGKSKDPVNIQELAGERSDDDMDGVVKLTQEEMEDHVGEQAPELPPPKGKRGADQMNAPGMNDNVDPTGEAEEEEGWWSKFWGFFKRKKTTDGEEEKEALMKRMTKWLATDIIGAQDLQLLESFQKELKMLEDLEQQPIYVLQFLMTKIRARVTASSALQNPVSTVQNALAAGCSYLRSEPKLYNEMMNDKLLTLELDEVCGDYVDEIPGLIKLSSTVIAHLYRPRENATQTIQTFTPQAQKTTIAPQAPPQTTTLQTTTTAKPVIIAEIH